MTIVSVRSKVVTNPSILETKFKRIKLSREIEALGQQMEKLDLHCKKSSEDKFRNENESMQNLNTEEKIDLKEALKNNCSNFFPEKLIHQPIDEKTNAEKNPCIYLLRKMDQKNLELLKQNRLKIIEENRSKMIETFDSAYEISIIPQSQIDNFDLLPRVDVLEEEVECFYDDWIENCVKSEAGSDRDEESIDSNHPDNSNNTYPDTEKSSCQGSENASVIEDGDEYELEEFMVSEQNQENKKMQIEETFDKDNEKDQQIRRLFNLCNDKKKKNTSRVALEHFDQFSFEQSISKHLNNKNWSLDTFKL